MALVLAATCGVAQASDGTPSQLLEKGIYTEETVGDLDQAIEIYQQAIDSAQTNRTIFAKAKLRLGLCYLKQGNHAKGSAALQKLIDEYPEQQDIIAEARLHLPDAPQPLELGPAPWTDGEVLRMDLGLAGGRFIGMLVSTADHLTVDGRDIWRVGVRRFVASNVNNQGVSRVDADAETFRPINSSYMHTILGNSEAQYGSDRVRIVSHADGGDKVRTLDLSGPTYDNEQAMHLLRRMPLAVGYKTVMPLVPIFSYSHMPVDVEVQAIETVTVPAGPFECYRVGLEIQHTKQTFWYSTDANRYLVKFEAEGIVATLAEISNRQSEAPVAYHDPDFGFSMRIPYGWFLRRHSGTEHQPQRRQSTILLVDPNVDVRQATLEVYVAGAGWTLTGVAERELEAAKRRFTDFTLRPESWQERDIAGMAAISFVGDYKESGDDYVQYRVYMLNDSKVEFIFKVAADRFEQLRPALDHIVSGLRME
jgi:tetratricopeptide (TPR) repeat protein